MTDVSGREAFASPPAPRRFPEPLRTPRLIIRRYTLSDAPALFGAVNRSRTSLLEFMPWARSSHLIIEDTEEWIARERARWLAQDTELGFGMFRRDGAYVGGIGVHAIDWTVPTASTMIGIDLGATVTVTTGGVSTTVAVTVRNDPTAIVVAGDPLTVALGNVGRTHALAASVTLSNATVANLPPSAALWRIFCGPRSSHGKPSSMRKTMAVEAFSSEEGRWCAYHAVHRGSGWVSKWNCRALRLRQSGSPLASFTIPD